MGPWRPGLPPCDWLARRCEKFTLEGAVCWIFSLPIKCGMQHSRRPFEVCCVCICVSVCVCVFVSVPSSFISTHRRLSVETRQPPEQVRWDLKPVWLFFHVDLNVSLIPSVFGVMALGGDEEVTNTTANYFLQCQNVIIRRGRTFSVNSRMCVFRVSHKRLLAPCLLFVRGVFCLSVISASLSLIHICTGEDAACFQRAHSDRRLLLWAARRKRKRCHRLLRRSVFLRELVHRANREKHKNTNISTRIQM